MRSRTHKGTIVGKVRAADPFELIRWLARSQSDPRKALAELVQNSLDAGARTVRITRLREHGVTAIQVLDDGEGVIPELSRTDALAYVATHIGYSRKRNLTPEERRELLTQGQYGIGLLGFWAIGQILEMRSQLPEEPAYVLRLFEDSPRYEIDRARSRLALGGRSTEVTVRKLHRPALASLSARRIAEYLASELRGQLLAREVKVVVHDRIARGRAPKVLTVEPKRFEGTPLPLPSEIVAEGFAPVRVELYLRPEPSPDRAGIGVSSAGTIVYEDLTQFEADDFRRPPWTDGRLAGILEFPDFSVPPGSRRGVVPDAAAQAFAVAVRGLEPAIEKIFVDLEERSRAEVEADLVRQLERAFRDLPRLAPEYDFFAVREERPKFPGAVEPAEAPSAGVAMPAGEESVAEEEPELLPQGPLAAVDIVPAETKVERHGERRLRATPRDVSGTTIRRPIEVRWQTGSTLGKVEPDRGRATTFRAGGDLGAATVAAVAVEDGNRVSAEAQIEIVDAQPLNPARAGIPEPRYLSEPGAPWRSRMRADEWQVNRAHPDFQNASDTPRRKLRYLVALLAKEVVLHSFPAPNLDPALERLIEVLTIVDRRLERGGGT